MRILVRLFTGLLLAVLLVIADGTPAQTIVLGASEAEPSGGAKIASILGFLLSFPAQRASVNPDSSLGQELMRIEESGMIEVSARFDHELSAEERAAIEALGVKFQTVAGQLAHLGQFYGVMVPVEAVDELAAHPLAAWLEATWRPVAPAPLDLSITYNPGISTYVDAPSVWNNTSPITGLPLTGQGVTIANFDTGVDVRHPAFLNGTNGVGATNWDTSGDGVFSPGVDQLGGETLRYWDAVGDPANTFGAYDVTQDWVYGDANGNANYDWNETLYMAYDSNADSILQAYEALIKQGTMTSGIPNSKIAATLNAGAVQRTRGVDLELTAADTNGHGTGVAGILGAGTARWGTTSVWPWAWLYTGVAPDADLVVADRYSNAYTAYIPWAQSLGAKVMLSEYGSWVYVYMDGSSNEEQMMDLASAQGILQVVPTGNLHCGAAGCNPRHLQYSVPGSGMFNHSFNVPVPSPTTTITQIYISMLWLNPSNNLTVQLTTPTGGLGNTIALPCATAGSGWSSTLFTADGHGIQCERAVDSSRGTALYNIYISKLPTIVAGNWTVGVTNPSASAELTNFYIADDSANAWSFGSGWVPLPGGAEIHTATYPSTCDSCLGVASYATRANFTGTVGALSWFSGRGPRFYDGARIVDVAAPGHYDIITPQSQAASGSVGSYNNIFGGTSAAGPHVAGMAALLYQYGNGNASASHVAGAIMRGAMADGFTGSVPNNDWGYGKLYGLGALNNMRSDLGDAPASANSAGQVMEAYPSVPANFPTVFAAAVPGPFHWAAGSLTFMPWDARLGVSVSAEGEADVYFDEEMVNNIQPLLALADQDNVDDGMAFPGPLPPCAMVPFFVHGIFNPTTPPPWTRYVNAWADWNADGDWGDVLTCVTANDTPEWILQNWPMVFAGPGGFNVPFPSLAYRGGNGGDPLWIRVSISEQMAPPDPATGLADGRGPAAGYAYGETEDYLYPQTDFQAAASVCVNDTLAITHDPASSWPVSFTWNFGDGTSVTDPGANPSHVYTQAGNRNITLTGTYMANPFSTYVQAITVNPLPVADFDASASEVCVAETVTFTDTSQYVTSYAWDFGDGGSSTLANPTHSYTVNLPKTYTVTLSGTNSCDVSDHQEVITVNPLPVADFDVGTEPVRINQAVAFTNNSLYGDTYLWEFGDGSSSTLSAPTHVYTQIMTTVITLTVTNECDVSNYTQTVVVQPQVTHLPLLLRGAQDGGSQSALPPLNPALWIGAVAAGNLGWLTRRQRH
ncbi:MAG: S8 family serine peptidase [Anaerolineales bacterium]|nr:S8 family serine peptidase [Anaerolineales bacterium]